MPCNRIGYPCVTLLAALTLVLAAAFGCRSPHSKGFATPAACVAAYVEAVKDGDVARYRSCLAEPLRSQSRETAESLRVKLPDPTLVQHEPEIDGSVAYVDVDEVRTSIRRSRFRLEHSGAGWLITAIGPPKEITPPVKPGTRVGGDP